VTCGVAGSDQGLVAFCRDTPASRAKQKEIRTKSLRFHNSKRGKQVKTGGRRQIGNNLRH
jgi:hypothetical protein